MITPKHFSDCPHVVGAKIALVHSEISETWEAWRDLLPTIGEEVADVAIRVMDLVGGWEEPIFWDAPLVISDHGRFERVLLEAHGAVSSALEFLRIQEPRNCVVALCSTLRACETMSELAGDDLQQEIVRKIEINSTRGHRHGGKVL